MCTTAAKIQVIFIKANEYSICRISVSLNMFISNNINVNISKLERLF
mgnify:CR=1 FL=1